MEISESVCRVCMQQDKKLTIFSPENSLIDMIHFCTTIEIVEHEKLPNGICDQCHDDLHVAYRFRTTCEQSNEKFWELLTQLESVEVVETEEDAPVMEEEKPAEEECVKEETIVELSIPVEPDGEKLVTVEEQQIVEEITVTKEVSRRRGRPRKDTTETTRKSKGFQCSDCGRTFTKQKLLSRHEKSHRSVAKPGRKVRVRRVAAKLDDGQRPCKFCKAIFPTRKQLNDHMNELHVNERPYLCSECGLRFVRNDYLVIHLRRHKGEKPYTCRFCGKGFPRATDLTVHERYHTGEKSHLCTICGKGFHRAYNLLVHMRVHTGEKPYQCPHCDKSFAQGNDLKAHVRRHTGERFKCDMCTEGFIQGYHLTQHKRQAHGVIVTSHIRRVKKFLTHADGAALPAAKAEEPVMKEEVVWEQSM